MSIYDDYAAALTAADEARVVFLDRPSKAALAAWDEAQFAAAMVRAEAHPPKHSTSRAKKHKPIMPGG